MESNLIINSTALNGRKLQKSITNINPRATNAQLQEVAQRLNALTTNTYNGATRIDKIDVEEDDVGGGVTPEPATGLLDPKLTVTQGADKFTFNYTRLGEGTITAYGHELPSGYPVVTEDSIKVYYAAPAAICIESDGIYTQDFVIVNGTAMEDIPRQNRLADPELKVYWKHYYFQPDWGELRNGGGLYVYEGNRIDIKVEWHGNGKIRAVYDGEECTFNENNESSVTAAWYSHGGDLFVGVESDGIYAPAFIHAEIVGQD